MSYKGVLIDLDHTLYDYKKAHAKALATMFDSVQRNISISKIDLHDSFTKARAHVAKTLSNTAASHNRMLYFQTMFELLGVNALDHTLNAYNMYWNMFLDSMELFEHTLNFLNHIQINKTCIVTDLTSHIQHRKLSTLGLEPYIDYLVTSEEAGAEKPDKKIFERALQKMGLLPHEVCMIGDNFTKDIWGATQLGIHAFWKHECDSPRPLTNNVTVFNHFKDLIELV